MRITTRNGVTIGLALRSSARSASHDVAADTGTYGTGACAGGAYRDGAVGRCRYGAGAYGEEAGGAVVRDTAGGLPYGGGPDGTWLGCDAG
jgi:hypothetical protein